MNQVDSSIALPTDLPPETTVDERPSLADTLAVVLNSGWVLPALLMFAGLGLIFWPMLKWLPTVWFGRDGYYTHGPLIPLISGYIVYKRWPTLKDRPVKFTPWVLALMIPVFLVIKPAHTAEITVVLSLGLIALMLLSVWFVAGWRWMTGTAPAILYSVFALPVWTMAIDNYTNPLQQLSTKVSFEILNLLHFQPFQADSTTIYLNHFTLNIAVACSGLKLVLAVTAFTVFFMLIANLKLWANIALAVFVLPLCLFINGLRIALIGMVGETFGNEAGHQFHDYSGYITLILCFLILFKVARTLGWKD